jgi:chemotaxis protein histidine kinase CheA
MDPIVHEFPVESFENLEQVDRDLVELENDPGDRARLDRIFRAVHTVKGTWGFLGMEQLEQLTHAGENLLALLRDETLTADSTTAEGNSAVQQLDLLTGELQEGVMQTRMQPVSKVLGKLPRMVRDLAAGCGKRVRLTLEGQETELDRSLLEAIRDPLTHLVRNAVDHGIEPPEERMAAGKPRRAGSGSGPTTRRRRSPSR